MSKPLIIDYPQSHYGNQYFVSIHNLNPLKHNYTNIHQYFSYFGKVLEQNISEIENHNYASVYLELEEIQQIIIGQKHYLEDTEIYCTRPAIMVDKYFERKLEPSNLKGNNLP